MKIELILLGVIGLVFLVDFVMNSRKKPSIDNVVDQIEGGKPVKTNNPLNYLLKRKKNFTLSIILILFFKIILHFNIYTSTYIRKGYTIAATGEPLYGSRNLRFHIDNVLIEELWLFIPVTIFVIFIAWFFNDKIKAR